MKELIFFNIRRHFSNKITILINIVVLLMIAFLFNIDFIVPGEKEITIYCDNTTIGILNSLQELGSNNYDYSQAKEEYTLHFDNGYKLICNEQIQEELLISIKEDINKTIKDYYLIEHPYLLSYFTYYDNLEVEIVNNKKADYIWIISTIIYFLIVNYSSLIASEVIYEKSTGILDSILTNVSAQEHLISKIVIGYLLPLIQIGIIGIEIFINYLIRYNIDKMAGLSNFINLNYTFESLPINSVLIEQILPCILVVVSGLLLIQVLLMLIVSLFSNGDQANSFLGLIQVVMLVIYYIWMLTGSVEILNSTIIKYLSLLPIVSMFLVPCRILAGSISLIEIIVAICINLLCLYLIVLTNKETYKYNLMKK